MLKKVHHYSWFKIQVKSWWVPRFSKSSNVAEFSDILFRSCIFWYPVPVPIRVPFGGIFLPYSYSIPVPKCTRSSYPYLDGPHNALTENEVSFNEFQSDQGNFLRVHSPFSKMVICSLDIILECIENGIFWVLLTASC